MSKIYKNITFLFILKLLLTQDLYLSMAESFLIHQSNVGIKTIGKNLQGGFLVSFQNGEAREYTSDFSYYTNISVPQVVDQFDATATILSLTLSNGSFLDLRGKKIIMLSNNYTTVRDYNYQTHQEEESYSTNATIIEIVGFPITVLNVSYTFHIMVCNNSLVIAYRGEIISYSYPQIIFLGGDVCTAALNSQNQIRSSTNQINANISLFISLGNISYKLVITFLFTFNSSINHFDLTSTSFSYSPIYTSLNPISSFFLANGILMIQSDNLGLKLMVIYNLNTSLIGATFGLPSRQTISFFYLYNAYYMLQSSGLLKLSYTPLTNTITINTIVSELALGSYGLTLSSLINVFYIHGNAYIYKASLCKGQSYMTSNNTCFMYNCSNPNCSYCPIFPTICSKYYPTFMSTKNQTQPSNQTDSRNQTNSEGGIYSSRGKQSIYDDFIYIFLKWFQNFMSIPAARRIVSPIFIYFGIFDDLYLYQFHDRIYSQTMNAVFENLNNIQASKWSIINYQKILSLFNIHIQSFQNATDYQRSYNHYSFVDQNHREVGSEGVWRNSHNFFIVGLPLIVIGFILFRILFKWLFRYAVSSLLRKFDFYLFLFLLLFDGNIQQFSFYQATDFKNMFFFGIGNKIVKVQTIIFGFCFVFMSAALYFLSLAFYARLSKYLNDNNKITILGNFSLTIQFGVKNIVLGAMHSFLRGLAYQQMILALFSFEVLFIIFIAFCISAKVYHYNLKIWISVLLNFIKMLITLNMLLSYNNTYFILQMVEKTLVAVLLLIFGGGILLQTYFVLKQLLQIGKKIFSNLIKSKKEKKKILSCQAKMNIKSESKQRQKTMIKPISLSKRQNSVHKGQQITIRIRIKKISRFANGCKKTMRQTRQIQSL